MRSVSAPLNAKAALLQALVSGPGYGLELIQRVAEQTGGWQGHAAGNPSGDEY